MTLRTISLQVQQVQMDVWTSNLGKNANTESNLYGLLESNVR